MVEWHEWIDNVAVLFYVSIFSHFLLKQDSQIGIVQVPRCASAAGIHQRGR